ncbi:MAG: TIR domain-containing protein, partial [Flavobacterium sp.]
FQLHHGKFHELDQENLDKLIGILRPQYRKSLDAGVKKNKILPARSPIEANNKNIFSKEESCELPENWNEIYNRLFELIDVKNDPATYFSGPRFIDVVKQAKAYFPDYWQYISAREADGKSTTRKLYYHDILKELNISERKIVLDKILKIVEPYDKERVDEINSLLYGLSLKKNIETEIAQKKLIVFISYSWDDESHKSWVLNLANKLINDEIEVKIDRHMMRLGSPMTFKMEQAIEQADKVLIIFTPNYKLKADNRKGGVGYEYSILNSKLYENQKRTI